MRTIQVHGIEFPNASEALQHYYAGGGEVILLAGRYFVVQKAEAERLAADGVEFAYVHEHELSDGSFRIVTVPVND